VGEKAKETWGGAEPYEQYVGRWSRRVARAFLDWLTLPAGQRWADIGCGTGGLVAAILAQGAPQAVVGLDRAEGFLAAARRALAGAPVHLVQGDAVHLPLADASCDVTVSGLVLNFVADSRAMAHEMVRVTRPGGRVAAYVWDYAGAMQMMRHFWDAAIAVSPDDAALDQGERFPLCQPEPLRALFAGLGLAAVAVRAIDIETRFRDFDDYWTPFLGKQGAAPTYLASLDAEVRERIRAALQARLVPNADGTIALTARAWAVQGTVPGAAQG
jgi:SAM-dependent methyltransferase